MTSVTAEPDSGPDVPTGRQSDFDALARLLEGQDARLVTVTGPGGVGKTALARAFVERPSGRPSVFVDLSPLHEARDLTPRVESALRGREDEPGLIVVLDNLEHLTPGAGAEVARLLRGTPHTYLATSRFPLDLRAEHVLTLGPLALPESDDPRDVLAAPAVQILLDTASRRGARLSHDAGTLAHVAELARRLDGLPLALRLAGSCLRVHPPRVLVDLLASGAALPSSGYADTPDRQSSLDAAVRWSYDLLGGPEAVWLRHLGLLRGPFGLDVAADLARAVGLPGEPGDALTRLVDASFVQVEPDPRSGVVYRLLHTIRHFATAELARHDEDTFARERYARLFREFASRQAALLRGNDGNDAIRLLGRHLDDVREARKWFRTRPGGESDLLGLSLDVARFLNMQTRSAEALVWLRETQAASERLRDEERASFSSTLAFTLMTLNRYEEARAEYERSLALLDRDAHPRPWVDVSFGLTHLLALTGDLHAALARSREAVEFTLGRGEPKLTVWAALPGVAAADELALDDEALQLANIALDAANEVGADYARASALNALGTALGGSGRAAEAETALREAQTLLRGMGLHTAADAMLHDLAAALTAQNRDAEAAEVLRAQWRALDPHPNVMADVLGRLLLEAALLGARAGRVRAAAGALPHVDAWVRDSYLRGFMPPRLRSRMDLVRSLVGDPDAAEAGGVPRPADLATLLGELLGGT